MYRLSHLSGNITTNAETWSGELVDLGKPKNLT